MQASNVPVDRNDYDMVEYVCELHESVLEAYTGIIQGLKGSAGEVRLNSLYLVLLTWPEHSDIAAGRHVNKNKEDLLHPLIDEYDDGK